MTAALTINIVLAAVVFTAVVGSILWTIRSAQPLHAASAARVKVARERSARRRGYGRLEGLQV